jgi:hypothetical protein
LRGLKWREVVLNSTREENTKKMVYMLVMVTKAESPVMPMNATCIRILHMIPKAMINPVDKYPVSKKTEQKNNNNNIIRVGSGHRNTNPRIPSSPSSSLPPSPLCFSRSDY